MWIKRINVGVSVDYFMKQVKENTSFYLNFAFEILTLIIKFHPIEE